MTDERDLAANLRGLGIIGGRPVRTFRVSLSTRKGFRVSVAGDLCLEVGATVTLPFGRLPVEHLACRFEG